jgi:transcriptional regulator with XRE-family HTH domain
MRAHEVIRKAREQAGLSDTDIAARSGLSLYEYGDIETYADEFTTAISLAAAKAICRAVHLHLSDVIALEPLGRDAGHLAVPSDLAGLPRNVLLRKRREALGLSLNQLADAIGFEDIVIERAEANSDLLETLPIRVVADLAASLQLPLRSLIADASD